MEETSLPPDGISSRVLILNYAACFDLGSQMVFTDQLEKPLVSALAVLEKEGPALDFSLHNEHGAPSSSSSWQSRSVKCPQGKTYYLLSGAEGNELGTIQSTSSGHGSRTFQAIDVKGRGFELEWTMSFRQAMVNRLMRLAFDCRGRYQHWKGWPSVSRLRSNCHHNELKIHQSGSLSHPFYSLPSFSSLSQFFDRRLLISALAIQGFGLCEPWSPAPGHPQEVRQLDKVPPGPVRA